tara:strand:- start:1562 stop:1810 length:249 start_codon:yes stop_codon:yes gene_type:complete
MRERYQAGDLVHIPQAVNLIDCDTRVESDPQLSIPLGIHETQKPEIAVVVKTSDYGYLRVFWAGRSWSVKDDKVYSLSGEKR